MLAAVTSAQAQLSVFVPPDLLGKDHFQFFVDIPPFQMIPECPGLLLLSAGNILIATESNGEPLHSSPITDLDSFCIQPHDSSCWLHLGNDRLALTDRSKDVSCLLYAMVCLVLRAGGQIESFNDAHDEVTCLCSWESCVYDYATPDIQAGPGQLR